MSDHYRLTVDIRNVAEGDATDVAQDIWDRHAEELDAHLGEFEVRVLRVDDNDPQVMYETDWTPDE